MQNYGTPLETFTRKLAIWNWRRIILGRRISWTTSTH